MNSNEPIYSFDRGKVKYYNHEEENHGLARASSRTHKQFLRKNHLGKFKKGRAK